MKYRYQLTCISESSNFDTLLSPLEEAADLTGLHPEMIEEFLRAHLVDAFEGRSGKIYFDQAGIARLRHIAHLREHEHTSLRTLRYIVTLLDNLEAQEKEIRILRERMR